MFCVFECFRARRYLGILEIPQYWNEMKSYCVNYQCYQYYHSFTMFYVATLKRQENQINLGSGYYWRQKPGTCKFKIIAKDQNTLIERSIHRH